MARKPRADLRRSRVRVLSIGPEHLTLMSGDEDGLSQVSQSQPPQSSAGGANAPSQLSLSRREFPVEVLPYRILLFVLEVSDALLVDLAIIAGPCLATLAGCIGNRRRVILSPGTWIESAILWIALVLPSGAKKTPALSTVLGPLQKREARELEAERKRHAAYEAEIQAWKTTPAAERGTGPEQPKAARRLLVSDITTEGLLAVHARNPLGLLLYRDELGGWLRSYNQYKGTGQGADAQTWCEMYQGTPALVDRKGAGTLSVPRAAVSILGGIQPDILRQAVRGEHLYDGVAARLLFIAPEEQLKQWTDETISEEAREGWRGLLEELLALRPHEDGEPIDLPITPEAKAAWVKYYNAHAQREAEEQGPLRSALSKLEGVTARLALVIQLAEDPKSEAVGVDAMKAGIAISEWFEDQARRVYRSIHIGQAHEERRELCEWIGTRGGKVTTRQLARLGPNKFRKRAQEALDHLVEAGRVKKKTSVGKIADQYVLCSSNTRVGGRK